MKALASGDAGRALGERAVAMVENQTGEDFTGTGSEWGRFAGAVGGDLVGTNQIVEGAGGYDLATQHRWRGWRPAGLPNREPPRL